MRYIIIILLVSLSTSYSKRDNNDTSPILPVGTSFQANNLRFLLGIGQNVQMGAFTTENWCDCPEFRDGVGIGFTLAAHYESEITKGLYWGAGLRLDSYGFESRYIDKQIHTALPLDGDSEAKPINPEVQFYQITELSIQGIGFNPHIRWYPTKFFMFRLGFNASYIFQSNIIHSEELINNITNDGKYIIQPLDGPVIYDGDFPDVNDIMMSVNFGVALPFTLPNDFTLAPGFEYTIPLSNFSSEHELQIATWRLTFEFKYPLSSNKYEKTKSKI